jgi:zinc transporter ZupT
MAFLLIHTSLIAFISSILGGIIPIKKNKISHYKWIHHIDSLCDGMFIAIAVTHLLPEVYEHSSSLLSFAFYCTIITATVIGIQIPIRSKNYQIKHWITYLLFTHCLIEGIAVSSVSDISLQATLSITILAHKMVESFVFFNLISRQSWSQYALYGLLVLFSLLTPIGIFIGGYLTTLPDYITLWVNTLTCGTFLGISTNCFLNQSCQEHSHHGKIWMILGFLALTLLLPMIHTH